MAMHGVYLLPLPFVFRGSGNCTSNLVAQITLLPCPKYFSDKAPPVARDRSKFARRLNRRCYPQARNRRAQLTFEQ